MRGASFPFLFPTQVGPSFCGLGLSYVEYAEDWPVPAGTLSLTWCGSRSRFPLVPQPYSLYSALLPSQWKVPLSGAAGGPVC